MFIIIWTKFVGIMFSWFITNEVEKYTIILTRFLFNNICRYDTHHTGSNQIIEN